MYKDYRKEKKLCSLGNNLGTKDDIGEVGEKLMEAVRKQPQNVFGASLNKCKNLKPAKTEQSQGIKKCSVWRLPALKTSFHHDKNRLKSDSLPVATPSNYKLNPSSDDLNPPSDGGTMASSLISPSTTPPDHDRAPLHVTSHFKHDIGSHYGVTPNAGVAKKFRAVTEQWLDQCSPDLNLIPKDEIDTRIVAKRRLPRGASEGGVRSGHSDGSAGDGREGQRGEDEWGGENAESDKNGGACNGDKSQDEDRKGKGGGCGGECGEDEVGESWFSADGGGGAESGSNDGIGGGGSDIGGGKVGACGGRGKARAGARRGGCGGGGTVSENFVRLNLKVKRYSKSGRSLTGSHYKRRQWKQRHKEAGSGSSKGRGGGRYGCFKCGKVGHWARNCTDIGGSTHLGSFAGEKVGFSDSMALGEGEEGPDGENLEELEKESPFPTIREAAAMAAGERVKRRMVKEEKDEELGERGDAISPYVPPPLPPLPAGNVDRCRPPVEPLLQTNEGEMTCK